MSPIKVLQAAVWWADGCENWPSLTFLLNRMPDWSVREKRAIPTEPGWHVYWAAEDEFATFFAWGGRPDDGFCGARRTVTLTDGSTEEIVGGWRTSGDVATSVGFPRLVDVTVRTDLLGGERLAGGTGCFVTEERFKREVAAHLPDVELCRHPGNDLLTVKWVGQPSKAEFQTVEHARRDALREKLKARYSDGSWHHGDWIRRTTPEEYESLGCRPYSALGPT